MCGCWVVEVGDQLRKEDITDVKEMILVELRNGGRLDGIVCC